MLVTSDVAVYAPGIEEIIRQADHNKWHVGKNISHGDFVVYVICDSQSHHGRQGCYTIRMDFYVLMQSENRDVWVVQAEIQTDDSTMNHVFVMDSMTMRIQTISHDATAYARSVQDTVLFVAGLATELYPKPLSVGQVWGDISSIDPDASLILQSQDTVTIQDTDVDVFVLQYTLFETTYFMINPDIPFPIHGVFYDPYWPIAEPPVRFTFEMIESSHTQHDGTQ